MLSTQVPGVQFPFRQEFGKVGRATQELGDTLMHSSEKVAEIAQRTQVMQDNSDGHGASLDYSVAAQQQMARLNASSKDGYVYDDMKDGSGNPIPRYMPDGKTRMTVADAYADWSNDYAKNKISTMSDGAGYIFGNEVKKEGTFNFLKMKGDALTTNTKYQDDILNQKITDGQQALISKPDTDFLYNYSQKMQTLMKNQNFGDMPLHDADKQQEILKKMNSKLAMSTVQGAWSQEILTQRLNKGSETAAINKWVSVLNGTDPSSVQRKSQGLFTLSDMLTPEERAQELKTMLDHLPAAKKADGDTVKEYGKNYSAALKSGDAKWQDTAQQFFSVVHSNVMAGTIRPDEGGKLVSDAAAKACMGQVMTSGKYQSITQLHNNAAQCLGSVLSAARTSAAKLNETLPEGQKIPLEFFGEAEKNEAAQFMNDQVREVQEARNKDFASSLIKTDPYHPSADATAAPNLARLAGQDADRLINLSSNKAWVSAAQKGFAEVDQRASSMGQPTDKKNYLPKSDSGYPFNAASIASHLSNKGPNGEMTSPSAVGNYVKALQRTGGKYYPAMVDQMIESKELPAAWALMKHVNGSATDPRDFRDMIDAINTPTKTTEELSKISGWDEKSADSQVAKSFGPWIKSQDQYNTMGQEFQADVVRAATNLARKNFTDNPKAGVDTAVKNAYNTFVGNTNHVIPVVKENPGWFNSNDKTGFSTIPGVIDGKPIGNQSATWAINNMMNKWGDEGKLKAAGIDVPAGADDAQKANYAHFIATHDPRPSFKYVDGVPSLLMTYVGKDGRRETVMKNGEPVHEPFDQLKVKPPTGPGPLPPFPDFHMNFDNIRGAHQIDRGPSSISSRLHQMFSADASERERASDPTKGIGDMAYLTGEDFAGKRPTQAQAKHLLMEHLAGNTKMSNDDMVNLMFPTDRGNP
jgi:hypothetical protein